jgi:methoxymalonate biosynthesis acyl carrier protein
MDNPEYKQIQTEIACVLAEKLNVEVPSEDTDLFETGILDSQKFVELLLHIEQQFGTHVAIEDFEIDNFRSIDRIALLVLRYKHGTGIANDAGAAIVERS